MGKAEVNEKRKRGNENSTGLAAVGGQRGYWSMSMGVKVADNKRRKVDRDGGLQRKKEKENRERKE